MSQINLNRRSPLKPNVPQFAPLSRSCIAFAQLTVSKRCHVGPFRQDTVSLDVEVNEIGVDDRKMEAVYDTGEFQNE